MEITVYRDHPLASEHRTLPAATYNLFHTLLAHSPGVLFVPIRRMQYLAIIDADEIVFVDHLRKNWAEIAWQHFHPQARTALDQPVGYEAVYYQPDGWTIMRQLQSEFPRALTSLAAREQPDSPADVLKFERKPTT